MYTIKARPEDFIVQEIAELPPEGSGYAYFQLTKKNMTTLESVRRIAATLRIPEKHIGFAGLKDKCAVTTQYISIKNSSAGQKDIPGITLTFLRTGSEPIYIGHLKGNRFEIVVRDAPKPKQQTRFINYFGEQRFSSANVSIGRALVHKDFKTAVQRCMDDNQHTEKMQQHLSQHPQDYVGALRLIPQRVLKLYVHAYQSFLWNKTADTCAQEHIVAQTIPLVGFGYEPGTGAVHACIKKILDAEGITPRDFIIPQLKDLSSEGEFREFIVHVDVHIDPVEDQVYRLQFELPKASYATEIVRQLFSEDL